MPDTLHDAAQTYAALGYRVFPLRPGRKTPLIEEWQHRATCDEATISEWWRRTPTANIGLLTQGLLAIDIDSEHCRWPEDPDQAADLAGCPTSITTTGGRHLLFRQPEQRSWRNTVKPQIHPEIDSRSDGGYIVAPPSTLGPGLVYRWLDDHALDTHFHRLGTPPAWLVQIMDRLHAGHSSGGEKVLGGAVNPIPEGQREKSLVRLAGIMRHSGMGEDEIYAAISATNDTRCQPPIPEKDVRKIAKSVCRYAPDLVATAYAEDLYSQLFGTTQTMQESVSITVHEPDEQEPEALPDDPGQIPPELLRVPGFVGAVIDYNLASAPYPEPSLAFASALVLQSLLAGRKVQDDSGNRTNLYVVTLAESGSGKEHGRRINTQILAHAGLEDCLGSGIASGAGLEDALAQQPLSLFQLDEFDEVLGRITKTRDGSGDTLGSMFLKMYSSASSIYQGRAKSGGNKVSIVQPHLCILATAIPRRFYESLSEKLMTNGFIARCLVIEAGARGRGQSPKHQPIPQQICDVVKFWRDVGTAGGNLAQQNPQPLVVPTTDEAEQTLSAYREGVDDLYAAAAKNQDSVRCSIYARAAENARKLALIYACSANHRRPEITAEAAEWAIRIIDWQVARMLYSASRWCFDSDFDQRRKKLLDTLTRWHEQHGRETPMPMWEVKRRLPWPPKDMDDVRNVLLDQELIDVVIRPAASDTGRGRAFNGLRLR